ncbi:MAG: glutamyl-tRNA reductase [Candidatus Tectimicrobiota bacterium]
MAIVAVGLNHTTAPIAVRERLAFSTGALEAALHNFRPAEVVELVILSTCNRVEVYMQTNQVEASLASCVDYLTMCHEVPAAAFTPHLYQHHDTDAVRHLFRVAASLDSLVLGEPQILGQVKSAYMAAQTAGRTGSIFSQLFERAFSVAKAVRNETGISDHAVSVSYAAVELAKKIFESLQQRTVMVLGAGDTAELAARHLVNQGVSGVFIANRTQERAERLAQELQAKAIPWETFPEHLAYTDIVVSSTSAPQAVIDAPMVQEAMRTRRGRPMFFIDIAVPRDIDPAINALDNVFLYDIDDLHNVVQENRQERQREALAAEELIWREVRHFQQWLASRDAVPTIVALRQRAEGLRLQELDKALAKLGPLDARQRQILEALTSGIVNKLLHAPTVYLKRASDAGQVRDAVQLVRHLFQLDT